MRPAHAPIGYGTARIDSPRLDSPRLDSTKLGMDHLDLDALLEENKQLRELVVQLSEIVVRNVLDRNSLPFLPPPAREG